MENLINEIRERLIENRNDYLKGEYAVREQLINPILNSIGWLIHNPKFVKHNITTEDGDIPDYTLYKDKVHVLIIEAKNLSIDINNSKIIDQLERYCRNQSTDFGVLTNGANWLLYKTFQKERKDRIVWKLDLLNDSIEEIKLKLKDLSYENIELLNERTKKINV